MNAKRWPRILTLLAILAAGALVGAPHVSLAQVAKLYPMDDAARDPSFFLFRLRLAEAVADRDTSFLYFQLAPGIKTSFGGGAGPADFKRRWRPEDPESELWSILARVLAGGGSLSGTDEAPYFEAPYWNSAWDASTHDPYEYGVIVGEQVNVRSQPSMASAVIGTLSYEIVRVRDHHPPSRDNGGDWVRIDIADGRTGYVSREFFQSPLGYRAAFAKADGRWQMQWFLAGD